MKTLVVFRKEFGDIIKSKTLLLFIVIILASLTPAIIGMRIGMLNLIEQGGPWEEIGPVLEYQIGSVVWLNSFLILILLPFVLCLNSLIQEKAKRITESLLATPLGVKSLWLGKSLGAFLPGFIFNLVIIIILLAVVNLAIIQPATGYLVLPWATLVTGLVILPILVLPLVLIVTLILLTVNSQLAMVIGVLLVVGLAQVPAQVFPRIGIAFTSWDFALLHLGIALLLGLIAAFLGRICLTKERVVLSCKA